MEYKFLKIIRLPYVKIFNITWALRVNGIPGFSEIGSTFWCRFFYMGTFFDEWEKNNVFRTRHHFEAPPGRGGKKYIVIAKNWGQQQY